MSRRLWLGASAADTAIRFAAQTATTIVVARLLAPEDFGVALMVLSIVAVFGTFVGQPIEEALAQLHHLRLDHARAALCAALGLTAAVLLLAPLVGLALARLSGLPDIGFWLPVATLFLIGEGPGAIARALARRHRRFVALSACQSASVLVASGLTILAASLGLGVFALILQRMAPVALLPVLAIAAAPRRRSALVRPAWNAPRFRDLLRFSSLHLSTVSVEAATPAAVAYAVNAVFGTATLGQLNVALRLVEPARQLVSGVGHNLAFAMLYRMQEAPVRLALAASGIVSTVATLAIPAFLGLAVCVPALLPLLLGPGWEAAIPLARALCLAAAVSVPFGFLYSAYSALGRPEYSLAGSVLHLVVVLGGLWLARGNALGGVGLALLAGDIAAALLAVALLIRILGRGAGAPLAQVGRISAAAALMAISLDLVRLRLGPLGPPPVELATLIGAGLLLYPPLLLLACPACLDGLRHSLLAKREPG